ncbi:MAG: LL-diaminopimelate aminotransferase [Planctomycetota bacterium]|jgi:LL-diaminopimelate aminotransferase
MVLVNENYLKLAGAYLFPEIARRFEAFCEADPAGAKRLIHCGIGDVSEPLPEAAVGAVHRAIDEMGRRETFRGYGPGAGHDFLRETIARHDFRDRGLEVEADEIFVSDGSKGDCGHILEILGTGSRVAVTDPVYPVYVDTNVMAGNAGPARADAGYEGIVYLPCTPANDFVPAPPPPQDPKLIFLCFPNNPTGAMITREQLQAWVDYAVASEALLLYDVAYQAYISDPALPRSVYEIDGARRCAIEFHSFSKNGGFTGLRCGYTVCPKTVLGRTTDGREVALHDLWVRRWTTRSNGVSYPVQRAAEALYSPEGRQQVSRLVEHYLANARILREGCEAAGLAVYGGVHAPYVWVACPEGTGSWQMFDRLLEEANVVVVPGCGFGACGEGFFRISAFNTHRNVIEVVERLAKLTPARTTAP